MKNFYAAGLACLLLFISLLTGAQKVWDGGAGNNSWNAGNNWNPNGVPAAGDAVTIGNGFTVVLDVTTTIASLTVGGGVSGTLTLGNGGANENLTVTGNINVNTGATMTRADDGLLTVGGNITNNGTFDMVGAGNYNILFNGAANQTLSGTGATTELNLVTINNTGAANNNIVEITSSAFSVPTDFLTLTDGVLKVSGSFALSNTFFSTAAYNINAASGLWINNANATVLGQNGNPDIDGLVRLSAGTYNVGTAASNALVLDNGSSLIIEGGTMNISGRLTASAVDVVSIDMSGGTLNISTVGNTSATASTFQVMNASSTFTMSGGTIVIHRSNGNAGGRDYENIATAAITGGTFQFGSAGTPAANDDFDIGSTVAGNHVIAGLSLVDNASSVPTLTITTPASSTSSLAIHGSVSIGAGTSFLPNGQAISVSGNWTNDGTFTPGTQTTTFNGTGLQTVGGVNTSSFSAVTINNTGAGLTLTRNIAVAGALTLTDGVVTTAATPNGLLTLGSGATIAGGGTASHINGPMSKFGSTDFTFPTGNGTLFRPVTIASITGGAAAITARYVQGNPQTTFGTALGPGVNHIGVCEYWDLDDGTAAVSAIVSLQFGASCNAQPYVDDPATLLVAHWTGTEWEDLGNNGATATSVTAATSSGLSPFTIGSSSVLNPLPVLFGNIKAYEKQAGIQVDWTVYQESNVEGYDVERSANGTGFTKIGTVGAQQAPSEVQYQFFDAQPYAGINFYRIVSRDVDGKLGFSNIVKVNLDKSVKEIVLYPNPVRGQHVSFQSSDMARGDYTVRIVSISGVVLRTQQFSHTGGALNQTIALPAALAPGMYTLQVDVQGERLFTKGFLVQ